MRAHALPLAQLLATGNGTAMLSAIGTRLQCAHDVVDDAVEARALEVKWLAGDALALPFSPVQSALREEGSDYAFVSPASLRLIIAHQKLHPNKCVLIFT